MKSETIICEVIATPYGNIGGNGFESCLETLAKIVPGHVLVEVYRDKTVPPIVEGVTYYIRGYLTTYDRMIDFETMKLYIRDKAIEVPFWINTKELKKKPRLRPCV